MCFVVLVGDLVVAGALAGEDLPTALGNVLEAFLTDLAGRTVLDPVVEVAARADAVVVEGFLVLVDDLAALLGQVAGFPVEPVAFTAQSAVVDVEVVPFPVERLVLVVQPAVLVLRRPPA